VDRTTINLEPMPKVDASEDAFDLSSGTNEDTEEAYFLDYLVILAREKRSIFWIMASTTLLAAIVTFALPNIYAAKAIIMPPQESQSAVLSALGQMAPLAALAGKDVNLKNPTEVYLAMLKSRTVADALIQRFDLKRVYRDKWVADARDDLEKNSDLAPSKEGIIAITVEDKDPKRASALANGYVEELRRLCQTMAVTSASERRLFFEQQVHSAKVALENAEDELKKTQERTGLIQLDSQARAIIESVSVVRAQIAAKEVQLQTMRSFATQENPEVIRTERALSALREELAKIEQAQNAGNGDINVSTGKVPTAGLEYLRKYRDVKYYESLYELIAKQYEAARLDEANEAPLIQALDEAVVPEKKTRPQRALIIAVTVVTSFFLAVALVLLKQFFIALGRQPEQSAKLQQLRYLLRWK
jgi:tyrosine-protein kinase Etk/Wzc